VRQVLPVRAFHGTTESAVDTILGTGQFLPSENSHDWLGTGMYFWQDAPALAWYWAEGKARKQLNERPAVIGAVLRLSDCMDFLDALRWEGPLQHVYEELKSAREAAGSSMPSQKIGQAHTLDCLVINQMIRLYSAHGVRIRCVRAPYGEDQQVFPGSAITRRGHVQIALLDEDLIEGIWTEPPVTTL